MNGLRVLDLSSWYAGPFATLLLAETGAEVIKIERPGGDPLRAADGLRFDFLNRRKQSVMLDLKQRRGRELFLQLVERADTVVEGFRPGTLGRLRLSYRTLRRRRPSIVLTSISNFGQTDPRRDWVASELVLQAMGGVMESTGRAGGPPLKLAGMQANYIAGANAAIVTLAAALGVAAGSERGAHIDVAIQETLTPNWIRHVMQYAYSGLGTVRGEGPQVHLGYPGVTRAADGYIYLLALQAEWESFAYFLGLDEFVTHEWSDETARRAHWAEIESRFHAAVQARPKLEWVQAGMEHGYTFAPIEEAPDVLTSPHLAARGFFTPAIMQTPAGPAELPVAGLPFSFDAGTLPPNHAPALGEHTAAVLGGILGVDAPDLERLQRAGTV